MGDRCFMQIWIGGRLTKAKLSELIAQLDQDGFGAIGTSYAPRQTKTASIYAEFARAVCAGEPAGFEADEVNYGNIEELEQTLQIFKIAYYVEQGPGQEYGAENRAYDPVGNVHMTMVSDHNGHPLTDLDEIVKARAEGALDELIANMQRCARKYVLEQLKMSASKALAREFAAEIAMQALKREKAA